MSLQNFGYQLRNGSLRTTSYDSGSQIVRGSETPADLGGRPDIRPKRIGRPGRQCGPPHPEHPGWLRFAEPFVGVLFLSWKPKVPLKRVRLKGSQKENKHVFSLYFSLGRGYPGF